MGRKKIGPIIFEYDGKELYFEDLDALAYEIGITKQVLQNKVRKGLSYADVYYLYKHPELVELSINHRIDAARIYNKFKEGLSYSEIVEYFNANEPTVSKSIVVDGVMYASISAACDAYGVKQSAVYGIADKLGCSIEEAIKIRADRIENPVYYTQEVEINGIKFKSKTEALEHYGLDRNQISDYRAEHKCSYEAAVLSLYYLKQINGFKVGNKLYNSYKDASSDIGIDYIELSAYEANNGFVNKAAALSDLLLERSKVMHKTKVTINGVTYSNIFEASVKLRIGVDELLNMIEIK